MLFGVRLGSKKVQKVPSYLKKGQLMERFGQPHLHIKTRRFLEEVRAISSTNLLTLVLLLMPLGLELEGPGGRWRGAITPFEPDPGKILWRLVRELSGSFWDFGLGVGAFGSFRYFRPPNFELGVGGAAFGSFRSITEWRGGGRGALGSPRGRMGK